MFREFALKNFKALKDVTVSLGSITVLIGPNGTGKSSVLQALALLKQSRGQRRLLTSDGVDLGAYDQVVHRRAKRKVIEFRLVAAVPEVDVAMEGRRRHRARFRGATYQAGFDDGALVGHRLELGGPGGSMVGSWNRARGTRMEPREIEAGPCRLSLDAMETVANAIRVIGISSPAGVDASVAEAIRRAYGAAFMGIHNALGRTYVVPAIRGFDKPAYALRDEPVDDFSTGAGPGEQASRALSTIAYERELEDSISDQSDRIVQLRVRARLVPEKNVFAEARAADGSRTNVVNEGFGANQLVVLLAQLVVAPEDSLLAIEEPEIHLHPQAQAILAEVFAEVATREGKQILLTTHSEHVLMGLLTQVAKGALKPKDLRVYYFQKDRLGVASAEPLEVDAQGRLKGGLKGFFEANIDELDHYLRAVSEPGTP